MMSHRMFSRMTGRKRKQNQREVKEQKWDIDVPQGEDTKQQVMNNDDESEYMDTKNEVYDLKVPTPKRYKRFFPREHESQESKNLTYKIGVLHRKINQNNMRYFALSNHIMAHELLDLSDDESDPESESDPEDLIQAYQASKTVEYHEPFTFDLKMTDDEIQGVFDYVTNNMNVIQKCHTIMFAFDEEWGTITYDSLKDYCRYHTFAGVHTAYPVLRIRDFFHQMELLFKYGQKPSFGLRVSSQIRNFFELQGKEIVSIFQDKFKEVNQIMNMYYLVRLHVAFGHLLDENRPLQR